MSIQNYNNLNNIIQQLDGQMGCNNESQHPKSSSGFRLPNPNNNLNESSTNQSQQNLSSSVSLKQKILRNSMENFRNLIAPHSTKNNPNKFKYFKNQTNFIQDNIKDVAIPKQIQELEQLLSDFQFKRVNGKHYKVKVKEYIISRKLPQKEDHPPRLPLRYFTPVKTNLKNPAQEGAEKVLFNLILNPNSIKQQNLRKAASQQKLNLSQSQINLSPTKPNPYQFQINQVKQRLSTEQSQLNQSQFNISFQSITEQNMLKSSNTQSNNQQLIKNIFRNTQNNESDTLAFKMAAQSKVSKYIQEKSVLKQSGLGWLSKITKENLTKKIQDNNGQNLSENAQQFLNSKLQDINPL